MTDKSIPVSVRIMEKEYKIACPEGEHESLMASATLLNEKMQQIKNNGKIIGGEKIAVMAAINIANDLLRANQQSSQEDSDVSNRLVDLKTSIDATLKAIND